MLRRDKVTIRLINAC